MNLLSITFVVLILVGCSYLVTGLFGLDQKVALIGVLVFVFSYVLMGGTYAHAYTNTVQGVMMILVTVFLVVTGWQHFGGDVGGALTRISTDYAAAFNPSSDLYFDVFSVFVSGFVVTFALMMQPHILTKVLYLRSEKDIKVFVGTTVGVGAIFMLMLLIGFYARLAGLDIETQDTVVREYLLFQFSGPLWGELVLTFIFITLLAAGMSTLDGILVSLSAMVVTDIAKPLVSDRIDALALSRWVLVGVGIVGLALAWNPPPIIGLFAQKGVYGLAAASVVPVVFGVLVRRHVPLGVVFASAITGIVLHLVLNLFLGVSNPAVSAAWGIIASFGVGAMGLLFAGADKH